MYYAISTGDQPHLHLLFLISASFIYTKNTLHIIYRAECLNSAKGVKPRSLLYVIFSVVCNSDTCVDSVLSVKSRRVRVRTVYEVQMGRDLAQGQ